MKNIFVASSSEAGDLDTLVRAMLDDFNVRPVGWRELARSGDLFLDKLTQACTENDAVILIATPDDLVSSRGEEQLSPRDNIILETGMAIGGLGRERVLIALFCDDLGVHPKLPSDLEGLKVLLCDANKRSKLELDIKQWIENLSYGGGRVIRSINSSLTELQQYSNSIDDSCENIIQKYVLGRFKQDVKCLLKNEIVLTQSEYFAELNGEIDSAGKGTEVIAVAIMSADMWDRDPEQTLYAKKNLLASSRGVNIRRLFICSDRDWLQIHKSAQAQIKAGIEVRRVSKIILSEERHLLDIVIFKRPDGIARGYIADKDIQNAARIRRGKIILEVKDDDPEVVAFHQVWASANNISLTEDFGLDLAMSNKPPGELMRIHKLGCEVITCKQASAAKGIELFSELKTLILVTSSGLVALHLRGDREASLRAVKTALGVTEAYLLPAHELEKTPLNLSPGTVSAVLEPVWSMPHLISRSLLAIKEVSTNAGALDTCYYFKPEILLQAKSVEIGDFDA